MDEIPDELKAGAAKALYRTLGSAIPTFDKLLAGPLERRNARKNAHTEIELGVMRAVGEKLVAAVENLTPQQLVQLTEASSRRGVLKQFNLAKIVKTAFEQLANETVTEKQDPPSDEFLDTFESIAENQSTERMQALFAKILAGEIVRPGSFSKRALVVAQQLDQSTAELFQCLCSMSIIREKYYTVVQGQLFSEKGKVPRYCIVCSLGGRAGNNALLDYGLSFAFLSILVEYGLVKTDLSLVSNFVDSMLLTRRTGLLVPFLHQGKHWIFHRVKDSDKTFDKFEVSGVCFTKIGHELSTVVDPIETPDYTKALIEFFRTQELDMVPINVLR